MKAKLLSIVVALAIFVGVGAFIAPKAYAAAKITKEQAVEWAWAQVGTKAEDIDNAYGAQCVDFIQCYYRTLGVSGGGGNACAYAWNSLPSGFTRIQDYYGFVPDPGDIAVWSVGSGGEPAGHVGVVLYADLNTLTVADVYGSVNETPYRKVHQTTYYYNGGGMQFWGVIRPQYASAAAPAQTFDTISDGTYFIYNRATNRALNLEWNTDTNCKNVHVYDYCTTNRGELMSVTSCSSDGKTYKIRPVDASRLVQLYGDYAYDGADVCIYDDLANSTQWWKFKNVGDGYAIFIDCDTQYALSNVGGDALLKPYTGDSSQLWELIPYSPTYTVNFNANGGSGSMDSMNLSVGNYENLSPNKFSRAGYSFKGWSTSSSANTAEYSDGASVGDLAGGKSSVTLYAVWEEEQGGNYTINFDGNGSTSGYMDSETAICGEYVSLDSNNFEKFGYRFKGWSTSKSASTAQYSDRQSVCDLASKNSSVTLYAVWEEIVVPQLDDLNVKNVTKNSISLSWEDLNVDGYDIYLNNSYYTSVMSNNTTITGLKAATSYCITVMPFVKNAAYSVGVSISVSTWSGAEAAAGAVGAASVPQNTNPEPATSNFDDPSDVPDRSYMVGSADDSSDDTPTESGSNHDGQNPQTNPAPAPSTSAPQTSAGSSGTSQPQGQTSDNGANSDATSTSTTKSEPATPNGGANEPTSNAGNTSTDSSGTKTEIHEEIPQVNDTSKNDAAQKAGIGAALSTAIGGLIMFLRKLLGK